MVAGVKRGPGARGGGSAAKRARGSSDARLKFKSPAEFFAENKNIAGFDNPGKSLYTTIRELVENGLDAAEAMGALPDVRVVVERIGKSAFRSLVGLDVVRERVDQGLYKDVENAKERKARVAKEKREAKKKGAVEGADVVPVPVPGASQDLQGASQGAASQIAASQITASQIVSQSQGGGAAARKGRAGRNEVFRVTVRDNGTGMAHDDVPNMMGRVLAGTKYCVRQSRGKFGLGSKMALIWSKMSTGLPVLVRTAQVGRDITTCVLDIDIARNIPNVIEHKTEPNAEGWNGTEVAVTIEGNWSTYRAKILLYMRQMAVITPYAEFRLKFCTGDEHDGKDFELVFSRRTDKMPRAALEVKHHPSSVNQLLLKQLIGDVNVGMGLLTFLTTQFVAIPRSLGTRLVKELGSEFTASMPVRELSLNHIRQLDALLHEIRFDKPDGMCLSPAGEYNLRLGITKELRPNMVATHAELADVFEGHPFIVEAGVALGGAGMKPGINVYRFANRIPLLFEAGNDVVTRTAREGIRWSSYKISPATDRIGVICSIVSTKVPFKGTGKEYIGDDSGSIKLAVKRAITQCCLQLKTKLLRKAAQKTAAERKKIITRYAPDVANAIVKVFEALEDPEEETRDVHGQVDSEIMTRDTLFHKLVEHVQQFDKEQALEYATATGRDDKTLETVFMAIRSPDEVYMPCLQPLAANEGKQKSNSMDADGESATAQAATASGVHGQAGSRGPIRMALLKSLQSVL